MFKADLGRGSAILCVEKSCDKINLESVKDGIEVSSGLLDETVDKDYELQMKSKESEDAGFFIKKEEVVTTFSDKLKENIRLTNVQIEEINNEDELVEMFLYGSSLGLTYDRIQINNFNLVTGRTRVNMFIKVKQLLVLSCDYSFEVLSWFNPQEIEKLYFGTIKYDLYSDNKLKLTGYRPRFFKLKKLSVKGNASKLISTYHLNETKTIECGYLFPFNHDIDEGYNTNDSIDQEYLKLVNNFKNQPTAELSSIIPEGYQASFALNSIYYNKLIVNSFAFLHEDKLIDLLVIKSNSRVIYRDLGLSVKKVRILHDIRRREINVEPKLVGVLPKKIEVMLTSRALEKEKNKRLNKTKFEPVLNIRFNPQNQIKHIPKANRSRKVPRRR